MYVNHEDIGCMGDFTKDGYTTQHIHLTTYHRDLVLHNTYFGNQQNTRIEALMNQTLIQKPFYLRNKLKLKRYVMQPIPQGHWIEESKKIRLEV